MTHEVVLHGYNVKPGSLQLGTFDSYGIEKIHVTADDEWAGLNILAVFHAPNGTATKVVVGADGMLAVPPEATAKQAGGGRIVFAGLAETVQRFTVDMRYSTKPHSDIEGDNPGTPTPDVVQQILENSNHAVSIATAAQEAAENARQAAEDAAKKAGEGAGGAAASAAAAKKSAEDAAASSESAAGKAEAAKSSANAANESAKAAQTAQGSAETAAQTAADAAGVAGQAADVAGSAAKASSTSAGEAAQSAEAAETAKQRAEDAAKKALEAKTGSENALQDADAAKDAASGYADAAAEKATAASASEKNAAKSANSAADSAAAAKKSAEDADNTANSIKDSMAQISENKEAVSQLKEDTAALQKRQNLLVGSETGNPVSCNDAYSAPLCGLTVYGKSMQDGTPTPDAPVPIVSAGDGGSVTVKVTGKNRMPTNLRLSEEVDCFIEKNTLTHLTFKDGIISRGGNLLFIGENNEEMWFAIDAGVTEVHRSLMITAIKYRYLILDMASENVCLTWNASSPDYEPYREQLLTLPTPNGLPGIPVTSGGNYTDPTGQQWVCDEVDLERGVRVQRIDKSAFDSTKTLAAQNATLTTPIETPLTPAEIAAYKALTAYAPDTVVQASDGAGVKLEYQRDVNIAIKNLEDAIASMTTT